MEEKDLKKLFHYISRLAYVLNSLDSDFAQLGEDKKNIIYIGGPGKTRKQFLHSMMDELKVLEKEYPID